MLGRGWGDGKPFLETQVENSIPWVCEEKSCWVPGSYSLSRCVNVLSLVSNKGYAMISLIPVSEVSKCATLVFFLVKETVNSKR